MTTDHLTTRSEGIAVPETLITQLEVLAAEHYKEERLSHAADILNTLVRWCPERADLWLFLGVIERRRERLGSALTALEQATTIEPENREALLHLGETLCKARRPREGVALLRAVFEMGHDPALPPEGQDALTIRAGACLEAIKSSLERWMAEERAQA